MYVCIYMHMYYRHIVLRNLSFHVSYWREYAKDKVDAATSGQWQKARDCFQDWLVEALQGGASQAHRFLKSRPMWRPTMANDPATGLPTKKPAWC